jgi:HEPN domain-containing protein
MSDPLEDFPTNVVPDQRLACFQFGNADRFLRSAEEARSRGSDDITYHSLAVAIELSLKSYLLAHVTDDDWNRVHIRHDLAKAVAYAKRAGLDPSPELSSVIALVHPYFRDGGFHHNPSGQWPAGFAPAACQIAHHLVATVAQAASFRIDT